MAYPHFISNVYCKVTSELSSEMHKHTGYNRHFEKEKLIFFSNNYIKTALFFP